MKRVIVFSLVVIISFGLYAQHGATFIGIKGGFVSSTLRGANVKDSLSTGGNPMNKKGFAIGLGLNSMISKNLWLKHDLLLIQKGAVVKINDNINSTYNSKFNLLYIDLYPISPTFHWKGFQVFAGPSFSMLIQASIQRKDNMGNISKDKSIYGNAKSPNNYTQKIDLGFVAGVEYELGKGLNVGVRYVQGFVPIIENALSQEHQAKIYNKNLNFSIGYTFGKEKKK